MRSSHPVVEDTPVATTEDRATLPAELFADAPVGLAFLDAQLRYVDVNDALAEINGVPREAHLGRCVSELWPQFDPRIVDGLRAVVAEGRPIVNLEVEAETPAAPGVTRSFLLSFRPVRHASAAVTGISCSVLDITDRKAAEAAARRSTAVTSMLAALNGVLAASSSLDECARSLVAAVRSTLNAQTAGLFLVDGDSFEAVAALGYPDDILAEFGRWPLDAASPAADAIRAQEVQVFESLDVLEARFPPLADAMRTTTLERRIATAPLVVDGVAIGALHVGFATDGPLDEDAVRHLRAVADAGAQAIARIRLAADARRGRQMLIASVEQMPTGVIVVDERGAIIHQNRRATAIWQGSAPPTGSIADVVPFRGSHPDGRPYTPEEWPAARSLKTGEVVVDEEMDIVTFGGESRAISVSSAPIVDDVDGRRLGAVVVFSDTTDRRAAEGLREAFLGMLAHELRTPVTTIYGAAHLLSSRRDRLEAGVANELTDDIEQSSTRLLQIVENLLVLARAERRATIVDPVPVLVRHLAARVVAREGAQWPDARIALVAGEVVPVMADEDVVELMLGNLVGNAAKYAGGDIEVALESDDDALRVCVRDRGPGLPDDELDRVFELFHRASTTAKKAPGSGIGLFVVRHLAEAQGGTAWARNRPGGGLEAGFSLPRL